MRQRNSIFRVVPLLVAIVAILVFAAVRGDATPTPTVTPTAAITPGVEFYPYGKNVTNYAFIGTNNGGPAISSTVTGTGAVNLGGRVILMRAGAAILLGSAVTNSSSADNTVITATSGAAGHVLGVCVGRMELGNYQLAYAPASGDIAIIQIDGIVKMVTDAVNITRGNTVDVSASQAGQATEGSATGTADSSAFGVALNSVSTGPGSSVFVLLETARSF